MVLLKAVRQLCGDYGVVDPGQTFEASEEVAEQLESRGLAERKQAPPVKTKVLKVAENKRLTTDSLKAPVPKKAPAKKKPAAKKAVKKKK